MAKRTIGIWLLFIVVGVGLFLGSMFSMISVRFESPAQLNLKQEQYGEWLSTLHRDPSAVAETALELRKLREDIASNKQWMGILMLGVGIVCLGLGIRMHSDANPKTVYRPLSKQEVEETERIAAARLAREEREKQVDETSSKAEDSQSGEA